MGRDARVSAARWRRRWRHRCGTSARRAARGLARCCRLGYRWRAAHSVGCDGSPSAARGPGSAGFNANFEWPTSRLGRPPSEREILVYDVLPIVVAGYVIGLGAIAITRFCFPRSSIKVVLYVAGACAGLAALFILWLSAAIGGTRNIRDFGAIAMLFAVPSA